MRDEEGVHYVAACREADYRAGVGGVGVYVCGVWGDAEGGEGGFEVGVFDPFGAVGDGFVVEDEAGYLILC